MAMTPEGRVKEAVKRYLKKHGIWFYMPVSNGMGVAGIPDFVCCWHGKFLGVETKAPGKRGAATENQKRIQREIIEHGGYSIIIDDVNQLDAYLTEATDDRIH